MQGMFIKVSVFNTYSVLVLRGMARGLKVPFPKCVWLLEAPLISSFKRVQAMKRPDDFTVFGQRFPVIKDTHVQNINPESFGFEITLRLPTIITSA